MSTSRPTTPTTTSTTTRPLVRLDALPQPSQRLQVDRAFPGRIRNVALLTTGPALGHGFDVDQTTVEQVARHANGLRGRWTHGAVSEDGLGRHLGAWERVRTETFRLCRACEAEAKGDTCPTCAQPTTLEHRAVGDFAFSASAYRLRPDGLDVPAPQYLLDRAAEDPKGLGISVVARFAFEEVPAEREGEEPRRLARLGARHDLRRGDWVADPAANPVGLSASGLSSAGRTDDARPGALHRGTGATSELAELAARELDRVVAQDGMQQARLKALAFLARYFKDTDDEPDGDAAPEDPVVLRLTDEVTGLRARLAEHERQATEARLAADAAFVERLKAESAAANAPIPEADVQRVAALLKEGHTDAAKFAGEALLARSKAQGQAPFDPGALVPLAPRGAGPAKTSAETQARALRGRGWTVELNQDGTAITLATPPKGA